jgi:hypothetical protein
MNGITTRDINYYSPGTNARGIIKAGTAVRHVSRDGWSGWVVAYHRDVDHFVFAFDWHHRFVEVPADAVKEN